MWGDACNILPPQKRKNPIIQIDLCIPHIYLYICLCIYFQFVSTASLFLNILHTIQINFLREYYWHQEKECYESWFRSLNNRNLATLMKRVDKSRIKSLIKMIFHNKMRGPCTTQCSIHLDKQTIHYISSLIWTQ